MRRRRGGGKDEEEEEKTKKKEKEEEEEEEEGRRMRRRRRRRNCPCQHVGQDSTDGTATHYRLDSQGIKSWLGKIFHTPPNWHWGPSRLQYNWYWVIPRVKVAREWQ